MNAVEKALNEYRIPNSWWPIPLMDALQRIDISLLIQLVADSILEYLSCVQHEHAAAISDGVKRAVEATSVDDIQPLLNDYYSLLHPLRDDILVSYVHLLQGKKFLFDGNVTGIRTQIVWALIFLGDTDLSRRNHIRFVVDNFQRIMSLQLKTP